MASYQVNVDDQLLASLLLRQDGMAGLLQQVLNQILVAQATEQIGAECHERTPERQGYRNGTRERTLQTRVGKITLSVPRFRDGEFSTELFARYQRSEQAFVLAMMEMVIQGVSTRKVTAITQELCGASFSKSTVSLLCQELDPTLTAWRNRPLSGDQYPFVLVDGLVIRVREGRQVHQRSALIAVGVSLSTGRREVLGLQIGDGESEASWSEFFLHLKERGLSGVDLVVSDQHKGLVNAVYKHFQGAVWQRCQVHFQRNIRAVCPKKEWEESVHSQVRQILEAPDEATARERLRQTLKAVEALDARERAKLERAMTCLEEGFEDAIAVLSVLPSAVPERYRRALRTTNAVERLNGELRRRERVIRIFPNRDSAVRLLTALLMEMDETWTTERVYLDMTEYLLWKEMLQRQLQTP
jgi:transposase-like protein